MKRIRRIVLLSVAGLFFSFPTHGAIHVHEGGSTSGACRYTFQDSKVREGRSTSGKILYTFRDRKICEGTSSTGSYSIDNSDRLYKGNTTTGSALYKISNGKAYKGGSTSGSALYNLNGRKSHKGSSTGSTPLFYLDGNDPVPIELLFLLVLISENQSSSGSVENRTIRVYQGNYASGTAYLTLKDGHLYRGPYTAGAPFYTFDGNRIHEGPYASGAPDYVLDGNGGFYIGQYPSGAPDYRLEADRIYRDPYASGAAAFIAKGNHLYRGQYASGAAAYTFDTSEKLPAALLFYLAAIVEDAVDVRAETAGTSLLPEERIRIREMTGDLTGQEDGPVTVRGTEEDIRASLALGIRPMATAGRIVVFRRPAVRIEAFHPGDGLLSIRAIPPEGGSLDPARSIQAGTVRSYGASSLSDLVTAPTPPATEGFTPAGPGAATMRLLLPEDGDLFLRIAVEP